jgi:cytoskeletal protein RodZ
VSIGETLAESRRQAGLNVTQVSQQTRIRESVIRAIEQGDFSSCGGDFYARGHIRSIAGVVGTDPVPLIRDYDEEHGPPGAISAADVFEPSTPVRIRDSRPLPVGKVLALALVAAAAFGVYRITASTPAKSPASSVSVVKPTAAAARPHKAAPKPVAKKPRRAPGQAKIVVTATQNCWIGIYDHNGKEISNVVVTAGTARTFLEKQAVSVRLGNPGGIRLTVNGKNETPNTKNPANLTVNPASTSEMVSTGGVPIKSV